MPDFVYLGILVLYSLYYFSRKTSLKLEVFCMFVLIVLAPTVMFKDFENYILETEDTYPKFTKALGYNLVYCFQFLYLFAYPICYCTFVKYTKPTKLGRYLFFCFTFFTLGLNQLYLCIGVTFYCLAHSSNNFKFKIIYIVLALICHVSIVALFIFDLYEYKKHIAYLCFGTVLVLLWLFQDQLLMLSFLEFDSRIQTYAEGIEAFAKYNIRNQLYSYVALALVCIISKDWKWIIWLFLIMLFSLAIYHQNSVMVRRFVELFMMGWIFSYTKIRKCSIKDRLCLLILLVFCVRNFFDYV